MLNLLIKKMKHKNGFSITGLKELDNKLRNIEDKLQKKIINSALRKSVAPFVKDAKANAPKDSGSLKKSIKVKIKKRRGKLTLQVRPFAPHFYLIEVGGDENRTPTKAKVLAFKGKDGNMVFAKSVKPAKPQPFFTKAYNQNKDNMIELFKSELIKQLQNLN